MVRLLQAWLWLREKGQGLVEYALILVLIAVVVIAILTVLGTRVSQVFSQIASALRGS
jgi:pilus assembly protein Flp/PilA